MDSLDVGSGNFLVWLEVEKHALSAGRGDPAVAVEEGLDCFSATSLRYNCSRGWCILIIFVFYCIPKSKRSVYLLPIYPFMAVLIAEYLLALVQKGARVFRICAIIFASLGLLLTLVFVVVRLGLVPDSVFGSGRHAAENVAFMHALEDVALSVPKWLLVALPVVAAVCTLRMVIKRADTPVIIIWHSRMYTLPFRIIGFGLSAHGAGCEIR